MTRDRDDREDRGEDFASRWSRRKRDARHASAEPEPRPAARAAPVEERSDRELLEELGLPEPESLKPGDDFSSFMAAAVPARLRNRALRRLWGSNPVLANLDGLIDYGEDFTNAATVPEVLNTAYRVGRGWAEDAQEEGEEESGEATPRTEPEESPGDEAKAPDEPDPESAEPPAPAGEASAADEGIAAGAEETALVQREEENGPRQPAPRRRMRFRFTDE